MNARELTSDERSLVSATLHEMANKVRAQASDARLNHHVLPTSMQARALDNARALDERAQTLDRLATEIDDERYTVRLEPTRKS